MFKKNRTIPTLLLAMTAVVAAAGCTNQASGTKEPAAAPDVSKEPATLTLFAGVALSDKDLQTLVIDPVKKKQPHITLKVVSGDGATMEKLIAANETPDLYFAGTYMQVLFDLNYQLDLQNLVKQHNIDLSSIDPEVIEAIRIISGGDKLLALPFTKNMYGLWYNKSLFDKFGASYPKDGMTWDNAFELARSLSRSDGGVDYYGIEPLMNSAIRNSGLVFSLPFVDQKTGKALIGDKWPSLFQVAMNGYNVPGNKRTPLADALSIFVKNQTLAMYPTLLNRISAQLETAKDLNWDVAQLPSFKELPNITPVSDYTQFAISKTTKYPSQAIQALGTLISDEVQLAVSRSGKLPVSKKPDITQQFAADSALFKGKHIQSIFKGKAARMTPPHKFDAVVQTALSNAFNKVYAGEMDINSALRWAEETANAEIATKK